MKQSEILKVLAHELGTSDLKAINQALKAKGFDTKFRITGPSVVHFGFTGLIKSLTPDGVKVYNVNKVNLIRYEDIQTFAKAKLREERKVQPPLISKKAQAYQDSNNDEEEDYENDDDFDEEADQEDDIIENKSVAVKLLAPKKKKLALGVAGSGSRFIPRKKTE